MKHKRIVKCISPARVTCHSHVIISNKNNISKVVNLLRSEFKSRNSTFDNTVSVKTP